jgi:hypothetical protein
MRHTRYVIRPGWVTSQRDGDRHWISAGKLLTLYRVPPNARVLIVDERAPEGYRPEPDDYVCEPRFDGNYPLFLP